MQGSFPGCVHCMAPFCVLIFIYFLQCTTAAANSTREQGACQDRSSVCSDRVQNLFLPLSIPPRQQIVEMFLNVLLGNLLISSVTGEAIQGISYRAKPA